MTSLSLFPANHYDFYVLRKFISTPSNDVMRTSSMKTVNLYSNVALKPLRHTPLLVHPFWHSGKIISLPYPTAVSKPFPVRGNPFNLLIINTLSMTMCK